MKLKKSLLALSTAASVAVGGAAVAQAEPATSYAPSVYTLAHGSSIPPKNGETETPKKVEYKKEGDKKDESEGKTLAGSLDNFFGWEEGTPTVDKIVSVGALITAVSGLVASIVALANNYQKLQELFQ